MMKAEDLFEEAECNGIDILYADIPDARSASLLNKVFLDYGFINKPAEEKVACAHGIGSIVTGSQYSRNSSYLDICRAEHKTNKWSYNKLIPFEELTEALRKGYTEPWELADYFEVTEEFVKDALKYYLDHGYCFPDAC